MLYDWWKEVVRERRGEFALCDFAGARRWTFAELDAAAERVESVGEGLALAQGNSPMFIFQVLAAWRAGKVLCPLDPGQSAPQLRDWEIGIERRRLIGQAGGAVRPVHLKVTSATSGPPKTIAFTAEQLRADVGNITLTMGLRRDWPNIAAISLAHSYGFSNLVLPLLLKGIPLVLLPAPLPEILKKALNQWGSTTIPAVPALWRNWLEAGVLGPQVKLAISAGAPLPLALEAELFQKHDIKVHNFYGSSECGGIAYDRTTLPRSDGSMVGQAMEGVKLSVAEEGVLVVESKAVGLTYLPDRDPTLDQGKFKTSDLAEVREGNVHLKGRVGDSINVAGRKISPETIEHIIRKHPAVRECLVFGAPSPEAERTEKVVACIAGNVSEGEIKSFLTGHLPGWQVPKEIWFVPEIAPNGRGKVSRAEWRARYERARVDKV